MEDRTLLAVQFTAAPLTTPANRADTALGTISGFSPIEPFVSVNPRDPGNVAVSSHDGIRVSANGGGGFTASTTFPGSFAGDTATAYDGAGRLFWVNLAGAGIRIVQVNPTTGALVPGTTFTVDNQGTAEDKPFLAADPINNNLYVVWTRFAGGNQILIRRSTNQGQTWGPAVRVELASEGFTWPAAVAVDRATGFVHVAYHSVTSFCGNNPCNGAGRIINVRFNNDLTNPQRRTVFGPNDADITFNVQTAGSQRVIPGMRFWTQGAGQPWILTDPTRAGHVYIVAADANNFTNDPMDVRIARSTDNGLTWGAPAFVDVGPGITAQMFPNAAIDRFGNIVVTWYDNRRGLTNGAGRFLLDIFARYSTDGGVSWSPAFQVTDNANAFDPDPGAINRFAGPPPTTRIGEYYGVGLFGGTAYVAWNGNTFSGATRVGQQVWFSAFAIRGSLTVTGTAGNDTITLRSSAGNADFVEVLVNGVREYAGLWSALTGITVNAGSGNDVINVENVAAGTPVTVNADADNDTVNITPTTRNLDNIDAAVTVNAGAGLDALTVHDQNNTFGNTWTLNSGSVARTGGGSQTITYGGFNNGVTIHGGTGATTFNVLGTTSFAGGTTLNSGTGVNVVNVRATSGPLTVEGQNSLDTVNIGSTTNTLANILGAVTVRNASSFTTININDQGTSAARTVTMTNAALTGLAPAAINYTQADVRAITVNAGSGGNTFHVLSTPLSGSFLSSTLNTGSATDTVNVRAVTGALNVNTQGNSNTVNVGSTANQLDPIAGPLTINGAGGALNALHFNDQGTSNVRTFTLAAGSLTRSLGPVINYSGITTLVLNGGGGGNTINVQGNPSTVIGGVTVNSGTGNDTIRVGSAANSLTGMGGVGVNGQGGSDTLTYNDQGTAGGQTYNLFALVNPVLERLGGGGTFGFQNVEGVTVNGAAGAGTYNVRATPAGTPVTINGGAAADVFNVGSTGNTLVDIRSNLTLNGLGGPDTVNVNDQGSAAGRDYFLDSAALTGTSFPASVNYGGVEGLTVRGATAGNNAYWVTGTAAGTPVTVVGSGSDYLVRVAGATDWTITATDAGTMTGAGMGATLTFSGCIHLIGSPDDDRFIFQDGQSISGYLDGSAGLNTLDYSVWTTGVFVELHNSVASGAGFVFNIAAVVGGAGDDYLHGDALDNQLYGNDGHDILVGDEGADYILGGNGADQIYAGGGADWIEGGFGEDLLIDGWTSYDYDVTALSYIWQEWTRAEVFMDGTPYSARIDNLRYGTGYSPYLLDANNVFTDFDADVLLGDSDLDWFWATEGFDFLDRVDPDEILN